MAIEAARRLKPYGKTITDAADFLLHHLAATESAKVATLVDDYLRAQQRAQLSNRHLTDVSSRLSCFKEDFEARPVRTIGAREVEEWLYGRNSAPVSF